MKCCCSRPTLAIIIGLLHTIVNLGVGIYCAIVLVDIQDLQMDQRDMMPLKISVSIGLAVSLVTVVLAITMIVGVVIKRYMMILPYLCLSIIGTGLYVGIYFNLIIALIWNGGSAASILLIIAKVALVTGVQILILTPIYSLYKEWRDEARGQPIATQNMYTIAPFAYQNVYEPEKPPMKL